MEHELIELRKHISAQRILVQDLMTGVCRELEEYNSANGDIGDSQQDLQVDELQSSLPSDTDIRKEIFLENIDVLLAELNVEEAIEALEAEEKYCLELKGPGDTSSMEASYRSVFLKRKSLLEDQLIGITEQPLVGILELKKALSALIKLGKGPLAHQLLLKSYGSRLQKSIEVFLPSCSVYPKTFPATLSRLMFSIISVTTKESGSIFGDNPVYTNRLVQWAEWEIEYFVRLVKNNAPSSETVFALGAASNCVQASLTYCSMLESQGLKLSKRARREALDVAEMDESSLLSPHSMSPLSAFDILAQLTPMAVLHFGANVLTRISQLFDKYMDMLFKSLPGPSDDGQSHRAEGGLICKASAISNCGWRRVAWERENTENLLARLTETVVMWLSEEQEFWDVFEDESVPLRPLGLQQLILDMHFTVEIACFAGYPSRHVQQIASAIITRAIRTFSARGIDPQSALPEDEWFVETAKTAINKLLLGTSGSDASEIDEDHVILHDEMVSDSDETASSLSSTESFESFASASMELLYKDQRFMLTSIVDFVVAIAMEADVSCQADFYSVLKAAAAMEFKYLTSEDLELLQCVEVEEMKVEEAHFRGRKVPHFLFQMGILLHKPAAAEDLASASIALEKKASVRCSSFCNFMIDTATILNTRTFPVDRWKRQKTPPLNS
ncbi:LOW QUALITY PROTEIN: exocyst complex component EXO84C-like [Populus alba x Populus x berolinensis]|nr:LOW QUALITY PROTEIN: exocyst complex component EXO84C-like [Populus alba x Populus x berolinensis]